MTVTELIEELKKMPADLVVVVADTHDDPYELAECEVVRDYKFWTASFTFKTATVVRLG